MSIDAHILKPLDLFELIQGDNALYEKIMEKIGKLASERRTIAAGSQ